MMTSRVVDAKRLGEAREAMEELEEGTSLHMYAVGAAEGQMWAELEWGPWEHRQYASVLLTEWVVWHQEGVLRVESV